MSQLEVLKLAGNALSNDSLDLIGRLPKLRLLDLTANPGITSIPEGWSINNLTSLKLSKCPLKSLPEALSLPALSTL